MGPVQQERVMGMLLLVPGLLMFVLCCGRSCARATVWWSRCRRSGPHVLRRVVPALVVLVLAVLVQVLVDGADSGFIGVIYAGFGVAALGRASVLARALSH